MQRLQYESSWEKALADKDREHIEQIFQETSRSNNEKLRFTPLWKAINYKGELLITCLVHNFCKNSLSFHNQKLCYSENNKIVAEHTFTLPNFSVKHETSMPWTFIFPVESIKGQIKLELGELEMEG